MANFIMGIISLSVSVVVLASVFIETVKNTSTNTNASIGPVWTTSEITMWGLLSLIAIVGMVFGVMQVFGLA